MLQPRQPRGTVISKPGLDIEDELRFLKGWLQKPLLTGAVVPSGKHLARTMASYVDISLSGSVIELGPGTGVVTQALVERGIPQDRLILVEFNHEFAAMMKNRYPRAAIIQGDAYGLKATLATLGAEKSVAVISSLPLMTKSLPIRLRLLREAFDVLWPGAPFIQFTYSLMPPIPKKLPGIACERSERIWKNLPPAQVWVYRRLATLAKAQADAALPA